MSNDVVTYAKFNREMFIAQRRSTCLLHQVTEENDFAKMGAHHTLDLELNKDVKIVKPEWDAIAFQRVQEACNEQKGAEIGAIILGEGVYSASFA